MSDLALPKWVQQLKSQVSEEQQAAWDHLSKTGLPNHHDERWRYTPLHFLNQKNFAWGENRNLSDSEIQFVLSNRKPGYFLLVFGYGRWHWHFPDNDFSQLARVTQIDVKGLSVEPQAPFPLIHSLACEEILSICVLENQRLKLQCVYLSNDSLKVYAPHLVLNLRQHSQCELLEINHQQTDNFILSRVQFNLKENSHCFYTKYHVESFFYLWQFTEVFQQAHSHFQSSHWVSDAPFMRHDLNIFLQDVGANCLASGFSSLNQASQYVDHHIDIFHQASQTQSEMLFKGIVSAPARSVFNGRLCVNASLHGVEAYQGNHHLLLHPQGEVRSKPELEIYSHDVHCKHGSSTGALDENALFYLQARGICEQEAKKILMRGFSQDLINKISDPHIQQMIQEKIYESN